MRQVSNDRYTHHVDREAGRTELVRFRNEGPRITGYFASNRTNSSHAGYSHGAAVVDTPLGREETDLQHC
jgi:hypothetical protein